MLCDAQQAAKDKSTTVKHDYLEPVFFFFLQLFLINEVFCVL